MILENIFLTIYQFLGADSQFIWSVLPTAISIGSVSDEAAQKRGISDIGNSHGSDAGAR